MAKSMTLFQNKWIHFLLHQLIDIVITFAISVIITYIFVGNTLFAGFAVFFKSSLYGFAISYTLWKGNIIVGNLIEKRFPWEKKPKLTLRADILAAIVYSFSTIVILNFLFYEVVFNIGFKSHFQHILIQMVIEMVISILITTIFYIRDFFVFWRKAVIREEKYKQEALSLQYETLKSYVNPHFLFNSLSVLSSLVESDKVKSQIFIRQLSDIYRYVLEQKDKELVPLETELIFAQSFIELHKTRHSDNLRVDIQVENKSGYIVPLSMQILLENAFKHNVISKDEPLEVKVWRDENYVIVQNKIQSRKTIVQTGGIGLVTIAKQYAFFTEKPFIVNSNNGFFTVKVPILDIIGK
jgi:two-component system, LytTR family, sensor kinase